MIGKLVDWVGPVTEHSRRWGKFMDLALWHAALITTPRAWYEHDDEWIAFM